MNITRRRRSPKNSTTSLPNKNIFAPLFNRIVDLKKQNAVMDQKILEEVFESEKVKNKYMKEIDLVVDARKDIEKI